MIDKEGSPDEGQAGFADDLNKAWDEVEKPEAKEPEAKAAPAVEETEAEADERERDEKGRFKAKEKDDDRELTGESDLTTGEKKIVPPAFEVPQHWSQAEKDAFAALSDELKPLCLEKVKHLEGGYTKKFQEIAAERKAYESFKGFKEIFDPWQQQFAISGTTPEAYVRKLMAIGQSLQSNPRETIAWLASQNGIDIAQPLGGDAVNEFADPEVTKLRAVLQEQGQMLQSLYAQQVNGITQGYEQEWLAFENAKDANGHAHFPSAGALKKRMGMELQMNPQAASESVRQAMERAYEAVKWIDPEVRKSIQEAEARERQRKADIEKAKKAAGPQVKSKSVPGADARTPGKDWKEELERNWDQASA